MLEKDEIIKKDFKEKEISTVDFAKKTLGQIVFLYFLQKKGWFGVAPDKQWGEGPKKFLRELFKARKKYGKNFFNDILEPLFYKALAQDRGRESIYPELNNCRMPFLNGGLFEPILNYSWETTDIVIPDELFSNDITNKKTGDTGTGILDVFDRYNFTVNENEPLEKEVAVDPEMLGKVFENLLDIKDRKSKGAFYTPREIVHYMCQQSLINYLETETKNEIPREDLELFIQKGDRIIENDKIFLERQKERIKKYGNDKYKDTTYSLLLPEFVRVKAKNLDDLLKNIKVADPAVGSGAFPLGMINEIVRARKVLNVYLQKDISDYDLKKHTITHSIYGVDIDPGAVDIAKLRLWLALVVDEETPHPLPNLEHKIMQGNSLLSEYEGIKLFDDSILEDAQDIEKEKIEINSKLSFLQKEYFELHRNNELTELKKTEIEKEIKSLQRRLKSFIQKPDISSEGAGLFDTPQKKKIAQEKANILQKKIEEYITESRRTNKQNLKEEIDKLKWDLIEISLEEQDKTDKLEEIKKLRHKNIKPFFIWKLEFSDVFKEKGGFDVVIGNPPYIRHRDLDKNFKDKLCDIFEVGMTTADIYCYFYELSYGLLRKKGVLAFITSNKWMRARYGEKLRDFLKKNTIIYSLIDLGGNQFETATVDTNVLIFSKSIPEEFHEFKYGDVIPNTSSKLNLMKQSDLGDNSFSFLNKDEISLKNKISKLGVKLEDCDEIKINYGILTGKNEVKINNVKEGVFIINEEKRNELIRDDGNSKELLLPILMGKNIFRYGHCWDKKYLVAVPYNFNKKIDNYPAIKNHLTRYKAILQDKSQVKRGDHHWIELDQNPSSRYIEEFKKNKVVWGNISDKPRFSFNKNMAINAPANFITSESVIIKYILAIMNSSVFFWEFKNSGITLGGSFEWKIQYVKKIHFPLVDSKKQEPFIDLVDQILEITSAPDYDPKNPPVKQKELEKQIDELVYKLYDLTDEEIKIVEESSKK